MRVLARGASVPCMQKGERMHAQNHESYVYVRSTGESALNHGRGRSGSRNYERKKLIGSGLAIHRVFLSQTPIHLYRLC